VQTRPYQFYTTANQANAVNRQIISPGVLYAVAWSVQFNSIVDNDSLLAELSFSSTSQVNTDNAQGVISACSAWTNFLTSGLSQGGINFAQSGLYFPVFAGQLLYLNLVNAAAAVVKVIAYISEP